MVREKANDPPISEEPLVMTDLIFAVAFVAMVATPAMVATLGGRKEYNPGPGKDADPDTEPETLHPIPPKRPSMRAVRPHATHRSVADSGIMVADDFTLPMHNGRGMANR
jgi:hypothetical protein